MLGLPSCQQVTELASHMLDEDLTWSQRAKLRVHLAMCKSCQNYLAKMSVTSKTIKLWLGRESMPKELKQTLAKSFRDQKPQ